CTTRVVHSTSGETHARAGTNRAKALCHRHRSRPTRMGFRWDASRGLVMILARITSADFSTPDQWHCADAMADTFHPAVNPSIVQAQSVREPGRAHVVVLGNEKGGSGKSTTAMHIVVSLMQDSGRVATIDLDARQGTLTRYIENRAAYAKRKALDLPMSSHAAVAGSGDAADEKARFE